MRFQFEDHQLDSMIKWMEEDKSYIDNMIIYKRWIKETLNKHSHNPVMRKMLSQHYQNVVLHITNEKEEYFHNYGSTYKLLSTRVKEEATC